LEIQIKNKGHKGFHEGHKGLICLLNPDAFLNHLYCKIYCYPFKLMN
jgi:hypothetical protein